jgi:hypothetical protein
MVKLILIAFLLFISACKTENKEAKQKQSISDSLIKYYNDYAFRENGRFKLYDLQLLNIDTISSKRIDTAVLSRISNLIGFYERMIDHTTELGKIELQQFRLYRDMFGNGTLTDIKKEDVQKTVKKTQEYLDSMTYLHKQDSLFRINMKDQYEK